MPHLHGNNHIYTSEVASVPTAAPIPQALWFEDIFNTYEVEENGRIRSTSQFVNLFFIDLEKGVDALGEEILDAKLPYDRVDFTTNAWFTSTHSHLVRFRLCCSQLQIE